MELAAACEATGSESLQQDTRSAAGGKRAGAMGKGSWGLCGVLFQVMTKRSLMVEEQDSGRPRRRQKQQTSGAPLRASLTMQVGHSQSA